MICYEKGTAPSCLTRLAAAPSMTWDSVGGADRNEIRDALLRDQGSLCAYCQRQITGLVDPTNGRSQMKIEHWIARSESSAHHFIWSNLLGVCLGTSHGTSQAQLARSAFHCDASRGNRKLFLHPVQGQGADPQALLAYTKNGEVRPASADPRITGDIDALNLNTWRLVRAREAVFVAAWQRLKRSDFAVGELRRLEQALRIVPGVPAPAHSQFLRYHVLKKIRQQSSGG